MSILFCVIFSIFRGEIMLTYDTIKKLCKDKGVTVTGIEKELGFARGSLCKVNTNKPSMEKVQKLADYFGVSVYYLMTGEEKEVYYLNGETAKMAQEMYEDEDMRSLFDMKRNMPPERFKAHMEFMKNLYNQEKGNDNM